MASAVSSHFVIVATLASNVKKSRSASAVKMVFLTVAMASESIGDNRESSSACVDKITASSDILAMHRCVADEYAEWLLSCQTSPANQEQIRGRAQTESPNRKILLYVLCELREVLRQRIPNSQMQAYVLGVGLGLENGFLEPRKPPLSCLM